jgi:hypothetical protein
VFPKSKFDHVVPEATSMYTYEGLVEAIKLYPEFCNENKLTQTKMQSLTTKTITADYSDD